MSADVEATVNVLEDYVGEGDFLLRWQGENVPEHAVLAGDVLVIRPGEPAIGDLAVLVEDRRMRLVQLTEAEPGLKFEGVVVGLMRRLA